MSNKDKNNVPERIYIDADPDRLTNFYMVPHAETIEFARVHSPTGDQTTAKEIDWITNKFAEVLECPNGMCVHCVDLLIDMSAMWEKRISIALVQPAPAGKVSGGDEALAQQTVDNFRFGYPPVQSLRFLEWEPLVQSFAAALATVRKEVEAEYALCRQVQKRGEHSSVTCPCVVATEETIRKEVWQTAMAAAKDELWEDVSAGHGPHRAEQNRVIKCVIDALEAAANGEAKGGDDGRV